MSREFEKEPPFDLRDRTKDFALRIVRMFTELPETDEARILGEHRHRSHLRPADDPLDFW